MDRFESLALKMGFGLMVVFFVALVGLAVLKGIDVPTCFTDFPPFKEGKVIQKGERSTRSISLRRCGRSNPTG